MGLVEELRWAQFNEKQAEVVEERERLNTWILRPRTPEAIALEDMLGKPLEREVSALDLLKRPEASYVGMMQACASVNSEALKMFAGVSPEAAEQVEIAVKYEGYIARQEEEVVRERRFEEARIPEHFDYTLVKGLSREVEQKLTKLRPATLGQAGRISGITPAAIALLLVHLRRGAASVALGGGVSQGEHAA